VNLSGTARVVVDDLWSEGRGWILIAISIANLLSLGVRLTFPALLPQIKTEFLLTNTTAGILLTVLWVSFATAQLPGGFLTDRIGERNTVVASMALTAAALAVIVFSPGFPLFVVGLALFGFGTGLYGTPRITVLSDIYPDRAATAISVTSAVGNVGNAAFPVIATVIAGWFAWRVGVGVGLPGFALVAVALWLVVPARTSPGVQRDGDESRRQVARRTVAAVARRPVVLATAAMICLGFMWQGFTAFLPTYLVEVKGIPQPVAATTLGAFFVGGAVVQPITASVADEYDERRILVAVAAGTAVALAAFPFANSAPVFVALSLLASLQLAFWPIIFAYIPRALPDDAQGSGFGLLRTLFLYVGATGSVAVGALADADLFDESFLILAGITVVATVLSTALPPVEE
jgi:MFS family permease